MKVKKKKLISKRKLHQKAWKIFSIHIRRKNADFSGYVACCCCGAQYPWNSGEIHAGHWVHDKGDFDVRNVHPQCYKCNLKWNWKKAGADYAVFMANKYGAEEMENIRRDVRAKGNDYSRQELNEIIEKYTELLKDD